MNNNEIVLAIANKVKDNGGSTYFVGGYVRDKLLGIDNKDIDIEVHGIEPEKLFDILKSIGKPLSYGSNFGIYSILGSNIDIALPRTEKNTGKGHRDFEIYIDPFIGLEKAIKRRDFTINGIYEDVLTHKIIDPFNGVEDLKNKIIKHIDEESFVEDPLRVLRACQFASRLNFIISDNTIELCRSINIKELSSERINDELKKALLKSKKPSIFFDYLIQMQKYDDWFKEIKYKESLIDEAHKYINKVKKPYSFMLTALCYGSNNYQTTLKKIIKEKDILKYIDEITLKVNKDTIGINNYEIYKTFNSLYNPFDYVYMMICLNKDNSYLLSKYNNYMELMNKPSLRGEDLIKLGYKPGEIFSKAIDYANDLKLKGMEKNEILQKTIEYININK